MLERRLEISEVNSAAEWNELVLASSDYTFIQSWQFGGLEQKLGRSVWRIKMGSEEDVWLAAQLFLVKARRGTVLQLRHAPLLYPSFINATAKEQAEAIWLFLIHIKAIAIDERCDFVRLQSLVELARFDNSKLDEVANKTSSVESDLGSGKVILPPGPSAGVAEMYTNTIQHFGFKLASSHNIDAEKTLILNVGGSEEELLTNMRKQTRYYIRRAEKDGVAVTAGVGDDAVAQFFDIHHDTTVRQKFTSHTLDYYQSFVRELNSDPNSGVRAEVYFAEYQGKKIAAAIVVFMGKRAFYSDGGSLSAYSKIPASYAIQWRAIRRAKELGCETYNFWGGVSPDKEDVNYPWYGIDLFKRGFGGTRVDYMHAHDLPMTWRYRLASAWENIEKRRRGY